MGQVISVFPPSGEKKVLFVPDKGFLISAPDGGCLRHAINMFVDGWETRKISQKSIEREEQLQLIAASSIPIRPMPSLPADKNIQIYTFGAGETLHAYVWLPFGATADLAVSPDVFDGILQKAQENVVAIVDELITKRKEEANKISAARRIAKEKMAAKISLKKEAKRRALRVRKFKKDARKFLKKTAHKLQFPDQYGAADRIEIISEVYVDLRLESILANLHTTTYETVIFIFKMFSNDGSNGLPRSSLFMPFTKLSLTDAQRLIAYGEHDRETVQLEVERIRDFNEVRKTWLKNNFKPINGSGEEDPFSATLDYAGKRFRSKGNTVSLNKQELLDRLKQTYLRKGPAVAFREHLIHTKKTELLVWSAYVCVMLFFVIYHFFIGDIFNYPILDSFVQWNMRRLKNHIMSLVSWFVVVALSFFWSYFKIQNSVDHAFRSFISDKIFFTLNIFILIAFFLLREGILFIVSAEIPVLLDACRNHIRLLMTGEDPIINFFRTLPYDRLLRSLIAPLVTFLKESTLPLIFIVFHRLYDRACVDNFLFNALEADGSPYSEYSPGVKRVLESVFEVLFLIKFRFDFLQVANFIIPDPTIVPYTGNVTLADLHTLHSGMRVKGTKQGDDGSDCYLPKFGFDGKEFKANPPFALNSTLLNVMSHCGFKVCNTDYDNSRGQSNGGHSHLRFVADSFLCDSLNNILQAFKKARSPLNNVICDLGSKFISTINKYPACFVGEISDWVEKEETFQGRDLRTEPMEEDQDEDWEAAERDGHQFRDDVDDTLVLIRPRIGQHTECDPNNVTQWSALFNKYELPEAFIDAIENNAPGPDFHDALTRIQVRSKFEVNHREHTERNGQRRNPRTVTQYKYKTVKSDVFIFGGTYEEFNQMIYRQTQNLANNDMVGTLLAKFGSFRNTHVVVNDTHYYMTRDFNAVKNGNVTANMWKKATFYITGMWYDVIPGYYEYLCKEGFFRVLDDSRVYQIASQPNTGNAYKHPLTIQSYTNKMSLGWYGWFAFRGSIANYSQKELINPLYSDEFDRCVFGGLSSTPSSIQQWFLGTREAKNLEQLGLTQLLGARRGIAEWKSNLSSWINHLIKMHNSEAHGRMINDYQSTTVTLLKRLFGDSAHIMNFHITDDWRRNVGIVRFDQALHEDFRLINGKAKLINGRKARAEERRVKEELQNVWTAKFNAISDLLKKSADKKMKKLTRELNRMIESLKEVKFVLNKTQKDMLYYLEKRLSVEQIEKANTHVINHDERSEEKLNWLKKKFLESKPDVRYLKKDQYVRSGFEVLCKETARKVHEFEWNSKSTIGMIWAFCGRQLSCWVRPDEVEIQRFSAFSKRMIETLVSKCNKLPLNLIKFEDWIETKVGWDKQKKLKYINTIKGQLLGRVKLEGVYEGTVKEGEVYYSKSLNRDHEGFYDPNSSRYRFYVNPSTEWCGFLTYVQAYIFKDFRSVFGEFCHALNAKKLKKRIHRNISMIDSNLNNLASFSIDGSKFDSTQHIEIINAVDNLFWKKYRPRLIEIVKMIALHYAIDLNCERFVDLVIRAATQNIAQVFLKLPKVQDNMLTPKEKTVYLRHYPNKKLRAEKRGEDVFAGLVCFYLLGTTYSGNPVRTTLGNTMRSVFYMYYYCYKCGLFTFEDWDKSFNSPNFRRKVWCIASGDDTVLWLRKGDVEAVAREMDQITTEDKDSEEVIGIAQIIVEKQISEWWDNEFCSKWFYFPKDGDFSSTENWKCTRDLKKLFTTKMIYKGTNNFILFNPLIHARAIFEGVQSEVNSYLINSICKFRLKIIQERESENISKIEEHFGEGYFEDISNKFSQWYELEYKKYFKKEFFASEKLEIFEFDRDYELWLMQRIGFDIPMLCNLVEDGVIYL